MNEPKDKLGRTINVGDYIVYAQRRSSSLWLDVGKVVATGIKKRYSDELPFIKVVGCHEFWNGLSLKRPGIVISFERVIVVSAASLPEKYFELLKDCS